MLLHNIINTLIPRTCICCGTRLMSGERHICLRCVASFPRPPRQGDHHDNALARNFWKTFPVEGVATAFCYTPDDAAYDVIRRMKYRNPSAELCRHAGRLMTMEELTARIFDEGDVLVPVPIPRARKRRRGHNQSEEICRGISEATGLPMDTEALLRKDSAPSQAGTESHLRMENVRDTFLLGNTRRLEHRHVIIIDDIITTGATIMECLRMLKDVPGIKISVAAFARTLR